MKRRHRRAAIIVFAVLAVAMLAINLYRQASAPVGSSRTDEGYYCTRVVDGDTIIVKRLGSVRLIGIDTPEMNYDVGLPEPYALESRRKCERLVDGKRLRLEFDVEKRDKYGRVLAYAFVREEGTDEEVFVNANLVETGMARAYHFPPNSKHKKLFRQLQRAAEEAGRGIWSDQP